jgi:hypothetical protein
MKITKSYLKQIIKEEYSRIQEETQAIEETEQLEEVDGITATLLSAVASLLMGGAAGIKPANEAEAKQAAKNIIDAAGITNPNAIVTPRPRPNRPSSALVTDETGESFIVTPSSLVNAAIQKGYLVREPDRNVIDVATTGAAVVNKDLLKAAAKGALRGTR